MQNQSKKGLEIYEEAKDRAGGTYPPFLGRIALRSKTTFLYFYYYVPYENWTNMQIRRTNT